MNRSSEQARNNQFFSDDAKAGPLPPSDGRRGYADKQNDLDVRRRAVEVLRRQLHDSCADLVAHGSNPDRIYRVRMLETCLRQAEGQLEAARRDLEAAIRTASGVQVAGRSGAAFIRPSRKERWNSQSED
jgi:hypothetical protein